MKGTKVLLFDIDDTLYKDSSGFTKHRNGDVAVEFMQKHLGFTERDEARTLREAYFEKYHSTFKSLSVADKEGKLPNGYQFRTEEDQMKLGKYWAENSDFSLLQDEKHIQKLQEYLEKIKSIPSLAIVAFTNGPREYALKVLEVLRIDKFFPKDKVFAVEDLKPFCKPEKESFDLVFSKLTETSDKKYEFSECMLIEDSVKNIETAKILGLQTVLIDEHGKHSCKEANYTFETVTDFLDTFVSSVIE
eukprot:maker-scaffold_7-snap-gene-19.79-mRNA-1 protein AED:0.00 eAED:0.00 QI:71/1/1/1/1/1/3/86/246